jgi:hypothetical protein
MRVNGGEDGQMAGLIYPYLCLLEHDGRKGTAAKSQDVDMGRHSVDSEVKASMKFATGKIIALLLIDDLLESFGEPHFL